MTNNIKSNRRQFFQWAGTGAAASMAGLAMGTLPRFAAGAAPDASKKQRPFRLAMASYSLRNFNLDDALKITATVGLDAICLKSMHLPLESSNDQIAAAVAKIKAAGILLYGGGVIVMESEKKVDQAFEYAKAAGMTKIVGVPSLEMLPLVNDKVQQYDITVCIHNHGPGDDLYPTPDVAYERIKNLDRRIGLCHDVGHTVRVGKDPAAISQQCADRLFDVHIKDVTEPTENGHSIACGRGVIDLPALLKTFAKIDYQGFLSFEYEEEPDHPLPALAESVGYIRGIMDMM
jgi:sugar phosphate isomerase/epimerase